jgi:hypothetical protein
MQLVYRRVLRRIGLVQLAYQLVEPGWQDDDEPRRSRSGVPESMRDACRNEHRGTGPGDDLVVLEPEAKRSGHDMPRLVICVVDVQGRDFPRRSISRPIPDHQSRSLMAWPSRPPPCGEMINGTAAIS